LKLASNFIAALLGITAEGVILYNSVQQSKIATQEAEIKRQIAIKARSA
jgi:hypothetical protein